MTEKPELERITQEEYENMLVTNMKTLKDNLKEDEWALEDFVHMYQVYLMDKNKYKLEFYKKDYKTYIYKKFTRRIGFK